jgi:hypothetical protein
MTAGPMQLRSDRRDRDDAGSRDLPVRAALNVGEQHQQPRLRRQRRERRDDLGIGDVFKRQLSCAGCAHSTLLPRCWLLPTHRAGWASAVTGAKVPLPAEIGDTLVIDQPGGARQPRIGEITAGPGPDGSPPYRVYWLAGDYEFTIKPGPAREWRSGTVPSPPPRSTLPGSRSSAQVVLAARSEGSCPAAGQDAARDGASHRQGVLAEELARGAQALAARARLRVHDRCRCWPLVPADGEL